MTEKTLSDKIYKNMIPEWEAEKHIQDVQRELEGIFCLEYHYPNKCNCKNCEIIKEKFKKGFGDKLT